MNYTTEIASYGNIIEKLPKDFCEKNPKLVLGGGILLIMLPVISSGTKYLTKELGDHFRYWVDAKYGKPSTVVLEAVDPVLLSDSTVA